MAESFQYFSFTEFTMLSFDNRRCCKGIDAGSNVSYPRSAVLLKPSTSNKDIFSGICFLVHDAASTLMGKSFSGTLFDRFIAKSLLGKSSPCAWFPLLLSQKFCSKLFPRAFPKYSVSAFRLQTLLVNFHYYILQSSFHSFPADPQSTTIPTKLNYF